MKKCGPARDRTLDSGTSKYRCHVTTDDFRASRPANLTSKGHSLGGIGNLARRESDFAMINTKLKNGFKHPGGALQAGPTSGTYQQTGGSTDDVLVVQHPLRKVTPNFQREA